MTLILVSVVGSDLISGSNVKKNSDVDNESFSNRDLEISNGAPILFQGSEPSLNITDTGNLYKYNQEVAVSEQEEVNLTYYLDSDHDWEVSTIETSITNIQDTRNWVNNSGFQSPTIFRTYQVSETTHPYAQGHNPNSVVDTITETGATYMRAHFVNISFERYYDYFLLRDDSNNNHLITDTENRTNVYSPWIPGDTLKFTYDSDSGTQYYGYYVDYYEFVNASSNYDINSDTWGFNYAENGVSGTNIYGSGEEGNVTGMYVGLYGEYNDIYDFDYTEGAFSEIYQNFSVPRGYIKDAYLSFDYNVPFGLKSNDNYLYLEINNQKVYSRGMRDIIDAGKGIWHSTGKIYMDLWTNNSEIFNGALNGQEFNISVGIMSGSSVGLTYFEEAYQNILWFDNVSLVLTASANSSQSDIDLKLNNYSPNESNEWGTSVLNITNNWNTNPIVLTVQTKSPSLEFELDTFLYGHHSTTSKIGQTTQEGVSYRILENGTVYWEFTHNFYMPSQYEDFEFSILKPTEWSFISVLDPTLQPISFDEGGEGDGFLRVNKSNAEFPGWWTFKATSPNYINISNTKMLKAGQWVGSLFVTGESTRIKTQINNSNMIPPNLGSTIANLTIYDPTGAIWYQESKNPFSNGTVIFSEITFSALSTYGGQYNYTIFWNNGTAVGGVKSDFILNHQSSLTLLKPDDAKQDLITEGFVGDIIPLRVFLIDPENNQSISNSIVSYNWTDGTHYFTEAALGIYEAVMDTADLLTRGLHNIVVNSSKIGFFDTNFTLKINLGEETNILVLESEYNIELHANSTIKFKFSDYDGDGINGALTNISIANESLYSITNPGNGTYNIEFSTLFIDDIGIHQLSINFSAVGYEPQYYIYQFQIIKQSVNLSVYINSQEKLENSLIEATFNDAINISARAISNIDKVPLTGGVITCISGAYYKNLTEFSGYWFNTSIICSPDNFSFGINYVYLQFEDPNYRTTTFGFQLLVDQIDVVVDPIGFEDSINAEEGETLDIEIQLFDPKTNDTIQNALITYSWQYGVGTINETTPGIYQVFIELPDSLRGNYKFDLTITPEGSIYKVTQDSFIVVIGEPIIIIPGSQFPEYLFWIIILVLVSVVSVLGILSVRSYVLLPRRRRKEANLLAKTQNFKDLQNIQAIVIIHRLSGIPIYSRSYSILEKHKKELFSGFIQAITTIGEEFTEKEQTDLETEELKESYGIEKFIELDFKYFYCLIADKEDVRTVFILTEKSSENLINQVSLLMLALTLKLSQELENWDGSLDYFEEIVPSIINEYFQLNYKESFRLSHKFDLTTMKKEKTLSKMEIRVLNVIQSMARGDSSLITLKTIVEMVSEENKDLVIEAIESLIQHKILLPSNP
ncbi:MAG: hypothetical protein ACW986_10330 [Promethearchaeota archaeon]